MKSNDSEYNAVLVIAGYHQKGCIVCRCKLVERHRLLPGKWGGKYESGNVVRLCPTHHKLLHVLIYWHHAAALDKWKPYGGKGPRGLCRLVTHIRKEQLKLWMFFWHVQYAVLIRRKAFLAGVEAPALVPLKDRIRRWREAWRRDDFESDGPPDVATISDLKRWRDQS